MRLQVELSAGELIDRITILELKTKRLAPPQRTQAAESLERLRAIRDHTVQYSSELELYTKALRKVNQQLWDAEEALRRYEQLQSFGARFVLVARSVYQANDRRAALKQAIDVLCRSDVQEFKSYALPSIRDHGTSDGLD